MANLRTANNKARRNMKRQVVEEGRAFHQSQVERMMASGTMHKLQHTRYALRQPGHVAYRTAMRRPRIVPRLVPNLVNPYIRYK